MREMYDTSDEQLLAILGEAFARSLAVHAAPSEESLAAFRRTIASSSRGHQRRRHTSWLRNAWVALLVATGASTVGAGVAFAAGVPLPGPLRSIASSMGLPVDSPAVSATRHAEKKLSKDLNAVGKGRVDQSQRAALAHEAAALRSRLSHLDNGDLKRLGTAPNALLTQASQVIATGSTSQAPTTTIPAPRKPRTTKPAPNPTPTLPTLPTITIPGVKPSIPGATVPHVRIGTATTSGLVVKL